MKYSFALCLVMINFATTASSEPLGKWFSSFGQGTSEYGITNDSAGSDSFHISCPDSGAVINISVGGKTPVPGSTVSVVVGAEEYSLLVDEHGQFNTDAHVNADNYFALWKALRSGNAMRVRLSTGQSTGFTLKGAAKVLPREECVTSFAQ